MNRRLHAGTGSAGTTSAGGEISPATAISRLKQMADAEGIPLSVNKARRLVLNHKPRTDNDVLNIWAWMGYADPTGSTAAHNIDSRKRRAS